MEPKKSVPEKTAATHLCEQADSEQDFESLLELASKLQKLIEARRKEKDLPTEQPNDLPKP
jgi:hypothetical protein